MQNIINQFCTLYYKATRIPITHFNQDGTCQTSYPKSFRLLHLPFLPTKDSKNPDFYSSPSQGFYGVIRLADTSGYIVPGPVYNVPATDALIRAIMRENAISLDQKDAMTPLIQAIPTLSFIDFLHNVLLLHYCLNQEYLVLDEHFGMSDMYKMSLLQQINTKENVEIKENQLFHNTYFWEQKMYHLIQSGDTEKLRNFISENAIAASLNEGIMADTPLRQAKNIFIGTITKMGTQAAIPGGLDVEQTYQLIDSYTRECEKQTSVTEVQNLHFTAALDFCSRLSENKVPEGLSNEVYNCMCYIRNHTNENIRISDVADKIHRSNSYIIHKFKNELGINIGGYITRCKLEEAKSLLAYSDKTLAEISSYLCFSSQSYFQNVFKKKYGITPMQYRKQHHTNNFV